MNSAGNFCLLLIMRTVALRVSIKRNKEDFMPDTCVHNFHFIMGNPVFSPEVLK